MKQTSVANSIVYNLLGLGLPIVIAFFAIPKLIEGLGTVRFGILTLIWSLVGYFNLFDLGLGRSLTKAVAEKLGIGAARDVPNIIWTSLLLMAGLGLVGTVVLFMVSPWLMNVLNVPLEMREETIYAFYIIGISIPMVICSAGLRGVLEAYGRFDLSNIIRVFLGITTFLGPLIILPLSKNLYWIVLILLLGRALIMFVYTVCCFRVVENLSLTFSPDKKTIRQLLSFGGWMTVSNMISPLMVSMDRFFISAVISVSVVAYYTTPYEMVTKLTIIPSAISSVLFPLFSRTYQKDSRELVNIYNKGLKSVFIGMFPFVLIAITFSKEILLFWIGSDFSENSFLVLQILSIGVMINGIAAVPFALIQGIGRPDITAKVHLIELIFYLVLLFGATRYYGIIGTAIAWAVRVAFDTALLLLIANQYLVKPKEYLHVVFKSWVFVGLLVIGFTSMSLLIKIIFLIGSCILFCGWTWKFILNEEENMYLTRRLRGCIKWS